MLQDNEAEASYSDTDNFTAEVSSYSKMSVDELKRKPLRRRTENVQEDSKKQCSNYNQDKKTEATSSKTDSLGPVLFFLFCLVLIFLSGLFVYMHWLNPSTAPKKPLDVQKLMRNLKSKFDGQPTSTYLVIESAIKRASSENSESPGIIVLISSEKTKDTTTELASKLVQLVSDPLSSVLIDSRYFSTAKQLKKEIDVTIQGNLTKQQMRAVLVKNLDQIPFEAAMIFHSYCDHENAPFKKVVYVMTTFIDETIPPTADTKQWDMLASKRLNAAWKDSGEDQVASLISRLTVSVAAVVSKE